eukprot:NODE_164_length_16443_cov_0.166544.p10 type:complete len:122 gc:universal NODE_164_length_16443_cov_0.166544:8334-8699(+)
MAAMHRPGFNLVSKSFKECCAKCNTPSRIAHSNSLVNNPLLPIWLKLLSKILSPVVVNVRVLIWNGESLNNPDTMSACAKANGDALLPINNDFTSSTKIPILSGSMSGFVPCPKLTMYLDL